MKSKSSKHRSPLALALALGLTLSAGATMGGVSTSAGKVNAAVNDIDPTEEVVEERQRPKGDRGELPVGGGVEGGPGVHSILKCWQKGRLLFEEKNWRPTAKAMAALPGPVLHSTDGRFDSLHLGDFGETFCFLKTRNGGY